MLGMEEYDMNWCKNFECTIAIDWKRHQTRIFTQIAQLPFMFSLEKKL